MRSTWVAVGFLMASVGSGGSARAVESFRFRLDVPSARLGQYSTATVSVVSGEGYRLNAARRIEMQLLSTGGLIIDSEHREATRVDESSADFSIRFKAKTPGEKSFRANLKFEVCDERGCSPQEETVSFSVDVK
jgi:hypothetical protein